MKSIVVVVFASIPLLCKVAFILSQQLIDSGMIAVLGPFYYNPCVVSSDLVGISFYEGFTAVSVRRPECYLELLSDG